MSVGELVAAILWQTRTELILTAKRGESLLVILIIPAALLFFSASVRFLPADSRTMSFLFPGTLALAVISTGLVSLGIATAYERYYGVLKRLGTTPLPRGGLVAAKVFSILGIEAVQVAVLLAIALGFGWRPNGSLALGALALVLGSVAFAGLGMAMAGGLRAEATLAGANGLFLFFLLLGGLYVPLNHLPSILVPLANALPAAALATVLRAVLNHNVLPETSALLLLGWAVAMPLLAVKVFRWE
ncbi:MAG: ABC transporter permease [Chloroflexota bacterium]